MKPRPAPDLAERLEKALGSAFNEKRRHEFVCVAVGFVSTYRPAERWGTPKHRARLEKIARASDALLELVDSPQLPYGHLQQDLKIRNPLAHIETLRASLAALARAAQLAADEIPAKISPGRSSSPAFGVAAFLVFRWYDVFGEWPGVTIDGPFARVLNTILPAVSLPALADPRSAIKAAVSTAQGARITRR